MKKIVFIIASLLAGFFLLSSCSNKSVRIVDYKLINSSDSNEFLHVSLQLDDFYNPFLTRVENEDFIKNFPQKNIKIIATYQPIMDKTGSIIKITEEKSYRTIMAWETDETVYNKINQIAFATNLQVNKNNQIISFDIPRPIKNKNQQYVLEGIYLYYPDFHSSKSLYFHNIDTVKYITIFYNKIDINKLNGYVDRFMYVEPLKLDIETDKFVDSSSKKLMAKNSVLKTNVWFANDKPIEKNLLSEEDKDDFFDDITIYNNKDLADITIPDSMLNWSNIENTSGSYHKGKTFEILKLEGRLSKYYPIKDRREIWIRQDGDLMYVEHEFFNYDCDLQYRIVFEKGNHVRRYIFSRYSNESKYNGTEFRKTYITQKNLNIFEKIKQQKKYLYDNDLKQINETYRDRDKRSDPNEERMASDLYHELILKNKDSKHACIREIDNMKRLLTTSKEELKQEFEVYKKTISR